VIEADDDAEILDATDEEGCETCAELSDELPCFECYMSERGHDVFV
jgi:hypothetical protein